MTGVVRQVAVVAAAIINVGVNALVGAGAFGVTTGAVSDSVETGVTPAGWAFSIWSVIFVGVLVFAGFQALPRNRGPRYDALAAPFILANLLNPLWQLPWLSRSFVMSALVILAILASLIWLYSRLDRLGMTRMERWLLGVPTSLFLGWLCVASAVNIAVALAGENSNTPAVSPPLFVLVIAVIGTALLWRTGDVTIAAVLVWAFVAIYTANVPSPGDEPALAAVLGVGVLAFVAASALALRRGRSPLPAAE